MKPPDSSRPSNEKWEEEESDYDKYDDDDDDIDELFSLANKQINIDALVSEHYSTVNG